MRPVARNGRMRRERRACTSRAERGGLSASLMTLAGQPGLPRKADRRANPNVTLGGSRGGGRSGLIVAYRRGVERRPSAGMLMPRGRSRRRAARLFDRACAEVFPGRLYTSKSTRHGLRRSRRRIGGTISSILPMSCELPLVATNEAFFADDGSMFEAHDVLLCVAEGVACGSDKDRRQAHARASVSNPRAEMRSAFCRFAGSGRQHAGRSPSVAPSCWKPHDPILPALSGSAQKAKARRKR